MKNVIYKKIYALIVVLVPVLYQYSVAGGYLDFDVIAMVFVFAVGVLGRKKSHVEYNLELWLILLYTIIITLFNILVGRKYSDTVSIIMRTGRYCVYLFIVLLQNIDYFDYRIAMNIYKKVAYLASIYIVIQAIAYYGAGITLPNTFGGTINSEYSITGQQVGRLRAFYSEPAAMAYSMLPFVVCSLFGGQWQEKDRRTLDAVIVTGAIILSTSGQGIVCALTVWVIWFVRQLISKRISTKRGLEILTLIVIAIIVSRSSIMEFAISRVANLDKTGAVSARASGYRTFSLLSPMQWIFGAGYGNYVTENIYGLNVPYRFVNYSSLAEYIFTTGILGTLMLSMFFVKRYRRGKVYVKVLFVVIAILSLSGSPLSGSFIPIYLSFAFCRYGEDKGELE